MITLKFHQLLQALDFALARSIEDNEAIFDSNITLKMLNTAEGDLELYAWMADSPESGSVKLERETPEALLSSFNLELDDAGVHYVDTGVLEPDEVYFVPHESDETCSEFAIEYQEEYN